MKYNGEHNPYHVSAIWEVRLRPNLISEIKEAATSYKSTMSWIVRYCVFKLFRKKNLSCDKLQNLADELREKNQLIPVPAKHLHRFRLCLYGDDERILLELKYQYRLTISMLIRIALYLYLKDLIKRLVSSHEFFFYGLKFFANTKITYSRAKGIPHVDFHIKKIMSIDEFWGIPERILPQFLLNS